MAVSCVTGALQDCPALEAARASLLEALPAEMPSTQSGLASIVVSSMTSSSDAADCAHA